MAAPLSRMARVTLLAAVAAVTGCYDFHLVGPEQPPPVSQPSLVSVTVVYTQPNACADTSPACSEAVKFYANWMQPGGEFSLVRDSGDRVWRGTAYAVPVNFPPGGTGPYRVWVHDPQLQDGATQGVTGQRLTVGGEAIRRLVYPDTPTEHGVVYVDSNGIGHNYF